MTSDHKGTIHLLKAGTHITVDRKKPRVLVNFIRPQEDSLFCDGCSAWWAEDGSVNRWSTIMSASECDPRCINCEMSMSSHADGKCLFGPTCYEIARYTLEAGQ